MYATEMYVRGLIHDEQAQDLVEYGLLAAFISITALVVIRAIGPLVDALYVRLQTALS